MKWISPFLLIFLYACDVGYNEKSNASGTLPSVVQSAPPKIMYLFFEIEKGNSSPIVKLHDKKLTDGVIKLEVLDNRREQMPNYLKIDLLTADQKVAKTFLLDDPLAPVMESYTPSGMEKEQASFEKADFSIRFNQDPAAKVTQINIYEINGQNSKLIHNQNL
ncbi:hypothetical protein [Soonwooa sp.]|uniref:hypothetical protein n=1 Tax=Soonwooa sp. TaxID=1938592 RepID=UPI0026190114|nr:hypothetical protein [Soonwooa sp.]